MARVDLRGKSIAITGASSGIGLATAIACAREGMNVLVAARRRDRLDAAVERIRAGERGESPGGTEAIRRVGSATGEIGRDGSRWGGAEAFVMDVTDPSAHEEMVRACERAFGAPVYAVYANAGYGAEIAVHRMSDAEARAIFETNFFGTLHTIRAAAPGMIARRSGHIMMCSSCVALMSLPYYGMYAATKAAQRSVSRAMHLELEPYGVHVSSVHPIATKTEFSEALVTAGGGDRTIGHVPAALQQSAEVVARATVRCLKKPRAEVWTSLGVRLSMALCAAVPGLEHGSLRKMVKRYRAANPGE